MTIRTFSTSERFSEGSPAWYLPCRPIELEAAILGAEIIGFLMQPYVDGRHFEQFIALLRNFFHGKGGDTPKGRPPASREHSESL